MTREFEDIFREHYDLVHGTAYGVTGRREDAEDVVQTVFLRLLRREMPQEFQRNPKAYLYCAVVNESLNIIRSRRRRPTTDIDHLEIGRVFSSSTPAAAVAPVMAVSDADRAGQLSARLEDQLGLRLVPEKAVPAEIFVIENVELATPN